MNLAPGFASLPSHSFSLRTCFHFSIIFIVSIAGLWSCSPKTTQPTAIPQVLPKSPGEPTIRVCIAENPRDAFLSFSGVYEMDLEEARYLMDDGVGKLSVNFRDGRLYLSNPNRYFELEAPQLILLKPQLAKNEFVYNETSYQGELIIHFNNNKVYVINKLPLETYLSGVLPSEIQTAREDYKAAVMAQAIASRSYALYRMDNPATDFYDIWADERDQVYRGTSKKTPLSERAIFETRGMVLANGGQPAITQYHSTCGGVLEEYIGGDPAGIAYDLSESEYNCKVSPHYRWVEFREVETILWNLAREFEIDSSQVNSWIEKGFQLDLDISNRKASGRVAAISLNVEGAQYHADGLRVRRALADKTGKLLKSNFFFIQTSESNPEKFYIVGAGAGHGSGMCQWGAIGMALKSHPHNTILGQYFPQLEMLKLY